MGKDCPLCDPVEHKTEWRETKLGFCHVFMCARCTRPMFVLKGEHRATFTPEEKEAIETEAKRMFGDDIVMDYGQKSIPDHAHGHVGEVQDGE